MVNQKYPLAFLLLSLCIHVIVGKSIVDQNNAAPVYLDWPSADSGILRTDVNEIAEMNTATRIGRAQTNLISTFTNTFYNQLIRNNVFCNLFSRPIYVDLAVKVCAAIAQSLLYEIRQVDVKSLTTILTNTLISVNPGIGPEAFGRVLANVIVQILVDNRILNKVNCFSLANKLSKVIIRCISSYLHIGNTLDLNIGRGLSLDTISAAKFGATTSLAKRLGISNSLNVGTDLNLGLSATSGMGVGTNANLAISPGLDVGAGLGAAVGVEANLGADSKINTDLNAGVGKTLGLNLAANLDVGDKTEVDLDVDLGISEDSIRSFQTQLTKELLKDKYFRHIFSKYIPVSALNSVVGAIGQYLSKAFGIPRSSFFPLEKKILILSKGVTPTLDIYAGAMATTISLILKDLNIIINSTVTLQVTMAAKAISSGIINFLRISSVPGVGINVNRNSYNSFFSVLNGLEKLPYVGLDAASRKLPSILKSTKANSFALQFTEILFNDLVCSSKFYESFSLGIPPSTYKAISNSLGKYMAEAFGAPNSSFFSNIYARALLSICNTFNYKLYARTISVATARALYFLGYFLSGNTNIQAAIATNAIIRALVTTLKPSITQMVLFPGVCNLPWTMQLIGVAPPKSLLKVKVGAALDTAVNLSESVVLGSGIGVQSKLNSGVKIGTGIRAGVELGAGVKTNLDVATEAKSVLRKKQSHLRKRDLISDQILDTVAVDSKDNTGVDLGIDANANIGKGLNVATNAKVGLTAAGVKKNNQLSILKVFPKLLCNRLHKSTALFTAITIVGTQKIINLVAQAIAVEFGTPVASIFLKSYRNYSSKKNNSFGGSVLALAFATADSLAAAGILNSTFTVLTADQLSIAVIAKYSSLIATSLESREWRMRPSGTYVCDQNQFELFLGTGYYI